MNRGEFIKSIIVAGVALGYAPKEFLLTKQQILSLPNIAVLVVDKPMNVRDVLFTGRAQTLCVVATMNIANEHIVNVRNIRPDAMKISVGDRFAIGQISYGEDSPSRKRNSSFGYLKVMDIKNATT